MDHVEKALEYFSRRFHCSQAVLAAFADDVGLTEEQALKLGGCFGGGMCEGEICGACTGALMALGLKYGQSRTGDLESRKKTNDVTVDMLEQFRAENGATLCRELLGCDLMTEEGKQAAISRNLFTEFCPKMVASAAAICERLMQDEA